MAEHNLHQARPFMPKQTFDQVSAMMWGQGALDYHTNYIIPRAHWDDSDIHEEALYFAGLARGLWVGAPQKPSQPMMDQGSSKDHSSVPVDANSGQMGSGDSAHQARAKDGRDALFQAHVVHYSGPKPRLREEIEKPSGLLSAPDGTTLTVPIADSQASKAPNHPSTSQPSVAVRKENNIMDPLSKDIPESSVGAKYPGFCTPSTLGEDSEEDEDSQERYWEEMERYFGGQADDTLCGNE